MTFLFTDSRSHLKFQVFGRCLLDGAKIAKVREAGHIGNFWQTNCLQMMSLLSCS